MEPFLLYITNFTLEIFVPFEYPISFATLNISSAVSLFTPFLWFKALETVAGEYPVILLIVLILAFILLPPSCKMMIKHFSNILNKFYINSVIFIHTILIYKIYFVHIA